MWTGFVWFRIGQVAVGNMVACVEQLKIFDSVFSVR